MTECLHATVEDFELRTKLDSGVIRKVTAVSGWDEGASLETTSPGRPERHGTFETPAYMRGLEPVIEGAVTCPDHATAVEEQQLFGRILAGGAYGTLTLQHAGTELLSARVRRAARVAIIPTSDRTFSYRLQLFSPDPYRYGPEQSASTGFAMPPAGAGLRFPMFGHPSGQIDFGAPPVAASILLENAGPQTAWPTFEVVGPVDGFRILDVTTGSATDFTGSLVEGASVLIHTATGRATRGDGADVTTGLRMPVIPTIPPYSQREFLFEPLSAATDAVLTGRVYPTYF
ncbi:hypothetical protein HMPREF0063_11906 [Aeromicrobium marinum DSM 15272]|uniref:Uncharacterized protein n=1 Tax=Aeromicrobium marinum DSM 15272 TaxID=585531 RepID=E2SDX0_9ACTN|nr:hypothetical protein [Aeromicrobium marinum]EFQ82697.1 hypothetical protein HMPREF0063_11906 [Aeromicrobium marinum DSM 15272]